MIVVISPHIDDMPLGVGGYIHRKMLSGVSVHEVIVGVSDYNAKHGAADFRLTCQQNMAENLNKKGKAAGMVYDYTVCKSITGEIFLENAFDNIPRGVLADMLESALLRHDIEELFIPRPSYNQDHEAVFNACRVMLRPGSKLSSIPKVWMYEVPGQSEMDGGVYVRLTKKEAMAKAALVEYHKQASTFPQSPEGVLEWARKRGIEVGLPYAEKLWPFKVIL